MNDRNKKNRELQSQSANPTNLSADANNPTNLPPDKSISALCRNEETKDLLSSFFNKKVPVQTQATPMIPTPSVQTPVPRYVVQNQFSQQINRTQSVIAELETAKQTIAKTEVAKQIITKPETATQTIPDPEIAEESGQKKPALKKKSIPKPKAIKKDSLEISQNRYASIGYVSITNLLKKHGINPVDDIYLLVGTEFSTKNLLMNFWRNVITKTSSTLSDHAGRNEYSKHATKENYILITKTHLLHLGYSNRTMREILKNPSPTLPPDLAQKVNNSLNLKPKSPKSFYQCCQKLAALEKKDYVPKPLSPSEELTLTTNELIVEPAKEVDSTQIMEWDLKSITKTKYYLPKTLLEEYGIHGSTEDIAFVFYDNTDDLNKARERIKKRITSKHKSAYCQTIEANGFMAIVYNETMLSNKINNYIDSNTDCVDMPPKGQELLKDAFQVEINRGERKDSDPKKKDLTCLGKINQIIKNSKANRKSENISDVAIEITSQKSSKQTEVKEHNTQQTTTPSTVNDAMDIVDDNFAKLNEVMPAAPPEKIEQIATTQKKRNRDIHKVKQRHKKPKLPTESCDGAKEDEEQHYKKFLQEVAAENIYEIEVKTPKGKKKKKVIYDKAIRSDSEYKAYHDRLLKNIGNYSPESLKKAIGEPEQSLSKDTQLDDYGRSLDDLSNMNSPIHNTIIQEHFNSPSLVQKEEEETTIRNLMESTINQPGVHRILQFANVRASEKTLKQIQTICNEEFIKFKDENYTDTIIKKDEIVNAKLSQRIPKKYKDLLTSENFKQAMQFYANKDYPNALGQLIKVLNSDTTARFYIAQYIDYIAALMCQQKAEAVVAKINERRTLREERKQKVHKDLEEIKQKDWEKPKTVSDKGIRLHPITLETLAPPTPRQLVLKAHKGNQRQTNPTTTMETEDFEQLASKAGDTHDLHHRINARLLCELEEVNVQVYVDNIIEATRDASKLSVYDRSPANPTLFGGNCDTSQQQNGIEIPLTVSRSDPISQHVNNIISTTFVPESKNIEGSGTQFTIKNK